tara:strand:- start:1352 stop:1708 length:357 start_codon:yes stop_codon:yes gene_type:complete
VKLLTKEIIAKLEKRGTGNENYKDDDPIITKFFNPTGAGTWYVMEGEQQPDGDWLFFGYVDLLSTEWGYFSLNELESVRLPLGLGIERDINFSGTYSNIVWGQFSRHGKLQPSSKHGN